MPGIKSQKTAVTSAEARKRKTRRIALAVLAVAAIGLAAVYFIPRNTVSDSQYYMQDGFSIGDPAAPVHVVEFSNFNCSHCRDFAVNSEADFIKNYVDTGKVYLTFQLYPFSSDPTQKATIGAHCAAESNKLWQYKEQVFKAAGFPGAYEESNLVGYAKEIGLDSAEFKACLQSEKYAGQPDADRAVAASQNVTGTPTFMVNGQPFYINAFIAAVDAELAKTGN